MAMKWRIMLLCWLLNFEGMSHVLNQTVIWKSSLKTLLLDFPISSCCLVPSFLSRFVSTYHIKMVKLRRAAEDKAMGGHFCHAARLGYSLHNSRILLTSFTSNWSIMFSNCVFPNSFTNFILNSGNCFWEVVHTSPRLTKRI
jgi:hypothetical protein